jgi:hypothetical protein
MHKKFWSRNLKGRDLSQNIGVDGRILERILEKWCRKMWTGFIWFRIGISGGLL